MPTENLVALGPLPVSEQSAWFSKAEPFETKAGHRLISPEFPLLPTAGLILVEEWVEREAKKGSLILIQGQERPLQTARVLAVCAPYHTDSGRMHQPPYLPGQTICYAQFSGRKLEIDGFEFILLTERDIIAVKRNL